MGGLHIGLQSAASMKTWAAKRSLAFFRDLFLGVVELVKVPAVLGSLTRSKHYDQACPFRVARHMDHIANQSRLETRDLVSGNMGRKPGANAQWHSL
jgi:hypothetical protein